MNATNEMESMNIPKLGLKISIPMVISMISIALYEIVDTMFISNINSEALAESVVNISDGTFKYDSRTIAEYTLKKYSQPVIRDRLIGVYEEAEVHHKEAEKSRTE